MGVLEFYRITFKVTDNLGINPRDLPSVILVGNLMTSERPRWPTSSDRAHGGEQMGLDRLESVSTMTMYAEKAPLGSGLLVGLTFHVYGLTVRFAMKPYRSREVTAIGEWVHLMADIALETWSL
jgi:hypothetical protein